MFNQQNLERALSYVLKGILCLVPFIVLVVSFKFFFPFIVAKNLVFRILVELAVVVYLGLVFLNKKYWPRLNLMAAIVFAFIAILFLANLFGINFYKSFWSSYERMEGFVTFIHLGLYFLILSSVFKTKQDWYLYWSVFFFAGFIEGIYGFLQIPSIGLLKSFQGADRVEGTMGNSAYMAAFMSFLGFIGLWLAVTSKDKILKYLYFVLSAFLFIVTLFTATRGAFVALALAAFFALIFYIIFGKKKLPALGVLLLFVVVIVGFYLMKDTSLVKGSPAFARFASMSFSEKTVQSRFMIWDIALKGFLDRPLLGYGQENFMYVFAKYYNPNLYSQEPWFDRAHNFFFDWLIMGGILGLLAYISLYAGSAYILLKSLFNKALSRPEILILISLLFSYLAQNFFVFDSINTYILIFAFFAFISVFCQKPVVSQPTTDGQFKSCVILAASFLAFIPTIYFVNILPAKQNFALVSAMNLKNVKGYDDFENNWEKAISYNTLGLTEVRERMAEALSKVLAQPNLPDENKRAFAKFIIDEMEKEVKRYPRDLRNRLFLISLYSRTLQYNVEYQEKALKNIDEAFQISSTKQDLYFAAADVYSQIGDYKKAFELLQKAIDLAPQFDRAKINMAIITAISKQTDIQNKDFKAAELKDKQVEMILSELGQSSEAYGRVAGAYIATGDIIMAMQYYQKASQLDPKNVSYKAFLADINVRLQNYDEAMKLAEELKQLDPSSSAQIDEFMKKIDELRAQKK